MMPSSFSISSIFFKFVISSYMHTWIIYKYLKYSYIYYSLHAFSLHISYMKHTYILHNTYIYVTYYLHDCYISGWVYGHYVGCLSSLKSLFQSLGFLERCFATEKFSREFSTLVRVKSEKLPGKLQNSLENFIETR